MLQNLFIFDTNTLISATIRPNSVPDKAFRKALLLGDVLYSDETLEELRTVLNRPKFDKYITLEERQKFFKYYLQVSIKIDAPTLDMPVCRDPKDDKYLALADASKAHFIVTGDLDLLVLNPFKDTLILKPAEFLDFDFSV
jgi:uncharacterized protein